MTATDGSASVPKMLAAFLGVGALAATGFLIKPLTSDNDSGGRPLAEAPAAAEQFERGAPDLLPGISGATADPSENLAALHGEFTIPGSGGTPRTLAWQLGRVISASATEITVESSDKTTWTWQVTPEAAAEGGTAAPKQGDHVYAFGQRDGDRRTASHLAPVDPATLTGDGPMLSLPDNCTKSEEEPGRLTVTCDGDGDGSAPAEPSPQSSNIGQAI